MTLGNIASEITKTSGDIINASKNGDVELVKLLLADEKTNPADQNNLAFFWASKNGHLEVVRLLSADERVNPEVKNNKVSTAAPAAPKPKKDAAKAKFSVEDNEKVYAYISKYYSQRKTPFVLQIDVCEGKTFAEVVNSKLAEAALEIYLAKKTELETLAELCKLE